MKINGKEIVGVGIIETALDGLNAKEFCLLVTYKKERKNGKGGYDIRKTTLPEIVKRNNDLALAIPEFIGENMSEAAALVACEKFAEKFGINILPIEAKRLQGLKAAAAAKKAAAESEKDRNASTGAAETVEKKAKKTAAEKIADIIGKIKDTSSLYKFEQLYPAMKAIDEKIANEIAEIVRRAYIPQADKVETAKTK